MSNETQSFGRPEDRPRQVFPEPGQPQYQQYQEPQPHYQPQYQPEHRPDFGEDKAGNSAAIALGVLAAIALLAAGVLFALWRSAAADADKPAPPPVTSTVTTTQSTTVTETVTEDGGLGDWLPSEVPSLPSLPEDTNGFDVEGWFRDTFGLDPAEPQAGQ